LTNIQVTLSFNILLFLLPNISLSLLRPTAGKTVFVLVFMTAVITMELSFKLLLLLLLLLSLLLLLLSFEVLIMLMSSWADKRMDDIIPNTPISALKKAIDKGYSINVSSESSPFRWTSKVISSAGKIIIHKSHFCL